MTKEYVVFEGFLGGVSFEISEDDYEEVKRFREVVVTAFSIEETFSLAAHSYIDFEKTLMSASLEWGLEDNDYAPHNDFFDHWREVINLKTLSILTAGNAYTEQMEKLAKRGDIRGFDWQSYDPQRCSVFDSDLCYRVMCAVRNFSVHQKPPITGISGGIKNESASGKLVEGDPWRQRLTCNPVIRTAPLLASKKIRQETRLEIAQLDAEGIDLKIFMRGYVESLFALHSIVRDLTESHLEEALKSILVWNDRLSEVKNEQCKHAYVGEKNAGTNTALYIDATRLTRIQEKRQMWGKLKGLKRRYISSEITQRNGISLGDIGDLWFQS